MIERRGGLEDRAGRDGALRLLGTRCSLGLELVRLPVALCGLAADREEARRVARCWVVERVLGHGWVVALAAGTGRADAAAAVAPAGDTLLPARLDLDECAGRLQALATRGALVLGRGRRAALPELGPPRAAFYPFWLSYRRDRRGRLCFDALDAVTGARPGSGLRAALAAALVDADAAAPRVDAAAP
jgi:hypothetical protein